MQHITLPEGKKVYFLSDLHLGASYFPSRHDAERRVVAFLDSIADSAQAIFLVGDVLDYWYEYRYVVPRGFVRFFGKLAELSDRGVEITWLIGNHDIWIFDYIPDELRVKVVDGSVTADIAGTKFFITHGDDIDDDSKSFRVLRSLFRNRLAQRLFAGIHPRWTIPFALGWSNRSRHNESRMSAAPSPAPFERFVSRHHTDHPDISYYIFGHLHILHRSSPAEGVEMIVTGDWIDLCSYAEFDGHNLLLNTFTNEETPAERKE